MNDAYQQNNLKSIKIAPIGVWTVNTTTNFNIKYINNSATVFLLMHTAGNSYAYMGLGAIRYTGETAYMQDIMNQNNFQFTFSYNKSSNILSITLHNDTLWGNGLLISNSMM